MADAVKLRTSQGSFNISGIPSPQQHLNQDLEITWLTSYGLTLCLTGGFSHWAMSLPCECGGKYFLDLCVECVGLTCANCRTMIHGPECGPDGYANEMDERWWSSSSNYALGPSWLEASLAHRNPLESVLAAHNIWEIVEVLAHEVLMDHEAQLGKRSEAEIYARIENAIDHHSITR